MTTRDIAELVLEYLKVLAWPAVVLFLVLKFRMSISHILQALADRLTSAESLKFGVLGQEVEISGTARELQTVRKELLASSQPDTNVQEKAGRILEAIPQLNNPIADIVGLELLKAARPLGHEDVLEKVLQEFSPGKEILRGQQSKLVLLSMAREVEKVLSELVNLDFATLRRQRYSLTDAGRAFFDKVATRQRHLLGRFAPALTSPNDA